MATSIQLQPPVFNYGKGIAWTTGIVVSIGFIAILVTALPVAVSTHTNDNKKISSASGYAWGAFVFELVSLILIVITMVFFYHCIENDPRVQKVWHERGEKEMNLLKIFIKILMVMCLV